MILLLFSRLNGFLRVYDDFTLYDKIIAFLQVSKYDSNNNLFTVITIIERGMTMYFKTKTEFMDFLTGVEIHQNEKLMIMVADNSSGDLPEMMDYLNSRGISFFGGIFPGLLNGQNYETSGWIAQKLDCVYSSLVLPYLMPMRISPENFMNCTAIIFADGLSPRLRDLIDTVYGKLGNTVRYIGGGAGFYNMQHKPCIFDNKGLYQDVVYICVIRSRLQLVVKHGWNKLEGPFVVEKSEGNILSQLDDENAFDLYRYVIENVEGLRLFKEDFFLFAKDHPFGILQEDTTVIVRDPISVNENNDIVLVADIPVGSKVYILKGDRDTLLSSSLQIAQECASKATDEYVPLLFDCISRAMFLEDRFEEELQNIQAKMKHTVEGALSIGEFASKRNGELVIHNKSTVLGLLVDE